MQASPLALPRASRSPAGACGFWENGSRRGIVGAMRSSSVRPIAAILGVEALVVAGAVALNIFFSLPEAWVEPADIVALPGENVELSCAAALDPPGPGEVQRKGLNVIFSDGAKTLGTSLTNDAGFASLDYTAGTKEDTHRQFSIGLELDLGRKFAMRRSSPAIYIECLSPGVSLYLVDLEATLKGATAADLDRRRPEEWPADQEAEAALFRLSRGAISRVVYLAPGSKRSTLEAHAYLRYARFPPGPVLFPEASPGRDLLAELRKKWPHLEYAVTRRAALVETLRAKDIPVVVVGAPAGTIAPAPKTTILRTWSEVK